MEAGDKTITIRDDNTKKRLKLMPDGTHAEVVAVLYTMDPSEHVQEHLDLANSGANLSNHALEHLGLPYIRALTMRKVMQIRNLHSTNSERINAGNSNTTPAVSYGNAVPPNPLGARTGSILGTSGNAQQNYTIPADTAYYVISFMAYVPAGTTGAQTGMTAGLLSGGENRAFTYDWDAPLSASTGVYAPSGSGASASVQVDDLGGGFRRFHVTLKNNNQTTLYIQHVGTAATNKCIYTAHQIVRVPDDGRSLRIDDYVPVGQSATPYTGAGSGVGLVRTRNRLPFSKVAVYSDSIWGAAAGSWRIFDSVLEYFGRAEIYSYGGNTTAQVCGYFDAANIGGYFNKYLIIFNCGRNDAGAFTTQAGRQAVFDRLKQSIAALGHSNFKVCGVLARFAATSAVGQEENLSVNTAAYNGILAYNAMLAAAYGEKFIDFQQISVNTYNPWDTNDAAAFALGMRPPSVAPLTGDGLHPGASENMILGRAVIDSIKAEYGVF
jgi:hypothetical protein